jgi:outer membrane protein OmpA-like peptidoglycan-associated protein
MLLTPMLPWLLLLGSCSTPPKPPTVDESKKRPANVATAVDLQACRNELHNTRILASEAARAAESSALIAQQAQQLALRQAAAADTKPPANGIYTVHFDFGSARVNLTTETAAALADEARQAPFVILRGRTDGATDSLGESRIARERAAAVRDYLVAAGVEPARIRATHQPVGDHAADNVTATGRGLNRRVEIEVYRAAPIAMSPAVVAQP